MPGGAGAASGSRRLALVAPSATSILKHRDTFLREVLRRGHRVLCLAPNAGGGQSPALEALGVECRAIDLRPPGLSILANRKVEARLAAIFNEWRPDVVMGYGARPIVMAALAARRANVGRLVCLVNGLPEHGLSGGADEDGIAARHLARAFKASQAIVVHNCDDARRLKESGVVPEGLPITVVVGAGVDLEHHAVQPLPPFGEGLVFLMISRLGRSRGVGEYAAAARAVKARAPGARFLLAGPEGSGSDMVTLQAIGATDGTIEYLGVLDDVRPAIGRAHVYVYPSRAEGMPRSVLEALAAGRPVITTSTPGCRETVDERVNGCLVPLGDVTALAEAIESFLKRPDLIPAMTRASRIKAERRFDARDVNRVLLEVLELG